MRLFWYREFIIGRRLMKFLYAGVLSGFMCLTCFRFMAFDLPWYDQQFKKNAVYQNLDRQAVLAQTANLFAYLRGGATLNKEPYTKREIVHLADVKTLWQTVQMVWISFMFIVFYFSVWYSRKFGRLKFFKLLTRASFFAVLFYGGLVFGALFFFNQLFTLFHLVVFRNDSWLLDPATENLVNIFPEEIFFSLVVRVLTAAAAVCLATALVARLAQRLSRSAGANPLVDDKL